jgi:hypothetical protein
MGPEGIFPAQNTTGQTGGRSAGGGRPYHVVMDRKEGGDIYGAPNWIGVGVALFAVAIVVVALVLELLD